jgi:hypothetical protein
MLSNILRAIVSLQDPLSIRDLASFIAISEKRIRSLLSGLHSVLSIPDDQDHRPIQTLHASFPDYLIKTRHLEQYYRSVPPDTHAVLAESSFRIMDEKLRFNVTNFPSSYRANNDVSISEFSESIGTSLAYASRFWGHHLQRARATDTILSTRLVERFAKEKILFWIEVLSVLQALGTAELSLVALIAMGRSSTGAMVSSFLVP